jgi:hypothetical protein
MRRVIHDRGAFSAGAYVGPPSPKFLDRVERQPEEINKQPKVDNMAGIFEQQRNAGTLCKIRLL